MYGYGVLLFKYPERNTLHPISAFFVLSPKHKHIGKFGQNVTVTGDELVPRQHFVKPWVTQFL